MDEQYIYVAMRSTSAEGLKGVRLSRTDGTETIKRTLFSHDTSGGGQVYVHSVSWS